MPLPLSLSSLTYLLLLLIQITNQKNILIIGAGVSGISAAHRLSSKGHNITILEGRNRIGGRIWTDTLKFSCPIELGASWLHGSENNILYKTVKESQIKVVKFDYDDSNDISNTISYNKNERDMSVNDFKSYIKTIKSELKVDKSIGQVYKDYKNKYSLSLNQEIYIENYLFFEYENEYSCNIDDLSVLNYDNNEEYKGDDYLFPDGYINLFKPMYDSFNIVFNTTVTSIDQSYLDSNNNKENHIQIITDKQNYTAEIVIVTVPLGVLKSNRIKFIPSLSFQKQKSIERIGMGSMEKLYVEFDSQFWENEYSLMKLYSNPISILGYSVNYKSLVDRNILLFLIGGDYKYLSFTNQTNQTLIDNIKDIIIQTYQRIYLNKDIKIKNIYLTNWKNDEFSFGSYSYFKTNSTLDDVIELGRPEGKVFFAGEHTHTKFQGSVHGAYESGLNVGDLIMNLYVIGVRIGRVLVLLIISILI